MEKKNTKNLRKVAYYIRVSTEEQAQNPEGSIKNQEERLKLTLRLKNEMALFGEFAGIYVDAGRSGKDMNRPELKRLLKDIQADAITMVMVTELSRLSRSIKDFSEIWEFMQRHECGFLSLRENFDTSTAAGEMMLYSIANFAQFERKQTSERVAANFEARAKRGLWNGGVLPMGYKSDSEKKGNLVIVESEAVIVKAAFAALIKEGSISNAAKWLNANGHRYDTEMRGGGFMQRNKHFIFDSLHRMLTNKNYIGIRSFNTKDGLKEVKATWLPIIDESTFSQAQQIIKAGKKEKTGRESRYPYLLSSRIYCSECGVHLIGKSAYGRNGKVGYYEHGTQLKHEQTLKVKGKRCTPFRVPAKIIDQSVWSEVIKLIEGQTREKLIGEIQKLQGESRAPDLRIKKEMEAKNIEFKIANLTKRIAELPDGVPANSFYDEIKLLTESNTRLASEISDLKQSNSEQPLITAAALECALKRLKTSLIENPELCHDQKRRIVHALIHQIKVTANGYELHFYAGCDQIKKGVASATPIKSLNKNFLFSGSLKDLNGGRGVSLFEPMVVIRKLLKPWRKPKIDLRELYDLRFKKGLLWRELTVKLGVSRSTLIDNLKKAEALYVSVDPKII